MAGGVAQSWVDPADPERLEYEYVQQIAGILDETVLSYPPGRRLRIAHLGGGGMSLPRYVEVRRPQTAQIVCEPDAALVAEVRRKLPLPRQSGIKVREVDGRSGLAAMPADYADAIIVDAFDEARIPAELASVEFFTVAAGVLRYGGVLVMNLADKAPFAWARRCVAGMCHSLPQVLLSAEASVWKGRRYGNMVAAASRTLMPIDPISARAARAAFPWRSISGKAVVSWLGDAEPLGDDEHLASPGPPGGRTWFG